MNGRKLKRVLRTNEALFLLDRVSGFPCIDWTHGGCLILAKSLKMLLPDGEILMVWNMRGDQAEHCVLLHKGRIYDGDGSFGQDYLAHFAERTGYHSRHLCFRPYDPECCWEMPDIHDSRLADFLAQRLDIHVSRATLTAHRSPT